MGKRDERNTEETERRTATNLERLSPKETRNIVNAISTESTS